MSTPASIRLPWRSLNRNLTGNSSPTCLFRAQNAAIPPAQSIARRQASDVSTRKEVTRADATTLSHLNPSSPPLDDLRFPRAVQAVYLKPLRRQPTYGVPVCDLQLRSYNVRNLEFFCDFALRAAYYLNLPASGPVPLPRIVERWTVPKGVFVHKKSQENFERRTVRRLIQIKDGHPEGVELWLAFLRKHAYYGIGMKANVFEFAKLDVGKEMDLKMKEMKNELDATWDNVAFNKESETMKLALDFINRENDRAARGGGIPKTYPSTGAGDKVFK